MSRPVEIPLARIAFAFDNPVDEAKVERYRRRLDRSTPPPVRAYRRTIDENDIGNVQFISGRVAGRRDVGLPVWFLTDGYHRALAMLPDWQTIDAVPSDSGEQLGGAVDVQSVVPDYHYVPAVVRPEMQDVVERTLAVGAVPPLNYLGAGATAVVFCDALGHGFKTARRADSTMLLDEAEWLAAAAKVPGVREHVARFNAYYPEQAAIERECVASDRDNEQAWRWRRGHDLFDLHQRIGTLMEKHAGWAGPEYKDDSYIITENRGPVLVDAGFVYRIGRRLLRYVADILDGRRPWRKHESPDDLAFYLRREVQEGALTAEEVAPVMARLRAAGASGW